MVNVSVGQMITQAYGFLFGRFLAIVGLSWLPAAFYAAGAYYWLQRISDAMLVSPHRAGGGLNEYALFDLAGLVFITAFISALIAVPLTNAALEPGDELVVAHFVVGRRELRLFLALLRFYVLLLAAAFAILFVGATAIAVSLPLVGVEQWQGMPVETLMNASLMAVLVSALALLAIRFGFFLAPVATAEPHARLARAWTLSRGNFWRLLLAVVAIFLPFLLLQAVLETTLWGDVLSGAFNSAFSAHQDSGALYRMLHDNAGSIAVISAASLVVFNALFAGSSAFGYETAVNAVADEDTYPVHGPVLAEPAFARAFAGYSAQPARQALADTSRPMEPNEFREPAPFVPAEPTAPAEELPVAVVLEGQSAPAEHGIARPEIMATMPTTATAPSEECVSAEDQMLPQSVIEVLAPRPMASMPPDEMPPLDPTGLAAAVMRDHIIPPPSLGAEVTASPVNESSVAA